MAAARALLGLEPLGEPEDPPLPLAWEFPRPWESKAGVPKAECPGQIPRPARPLEPAQREGSLFFFFIQNGVFFEKKFGIWEFRPIHRFFPNEKVPPRVGTKARFPPAWDCRACLPEELGGRPGRGREAGRSPKMLANGVSTHPGAWEGRAELQGPAGRAKSRAPGREGSLAEELGRAGAGRPGRLGGTLGSLLTASASFLADWRSCEGPGA